ncbi:MAG: sigma 54-interacting transcriptional regulator [Polyangiales bacterium]
MLMLHEVHDDADTVCRRLDGPLPVLLPEIPHALVVPDDIGALVLDDGRRVLTRLHPGEPVRFGPLTLLVTLDDARSTERLRAVKLPAALTLRTDAASVTPLAGDRLVLGRDARCDLRLDDATVSAAHAELCRDGARWMLRDLHSTNGVRVNGARVREAWIDRGDVITMGRSSLRVEAVGDAEGGDEELSGASGPMRALRSDVRRFAEAPYPALVTGESGSGKELVARALHRGSPRARGPFVAVNCGALSPEVVESELFGHERGAFTGAVARRRGLFEEASEGTLFLDEVGELTPALQTRLLRVLETGEVRRVGAEAVTRVNVRVVSATWRDLDAMVEDGRFRLDLLYRLAVLRVRVPALRERTSDIPALCATLLDRIHRECGRRRVLEDRALATLMLLPWPGNVRELLAVLRRAVFLCDGRVITPRHVALACPAAAGLDPARVGVAPAVLRDDDQDAGLRALLAQFEGNLSRVSKLTGIARSTIRYRLTRRADGGPRDIAGSARYDQRR